MLGIKDNLLRNGSYAQTIDDYYELSKKGGLSQIQIFEICCKEHQLVVFIDGDGPGTITEQNYLCENYIFQGKVIFFIEESKFDSLKDNPSEYIRNFPTIITFKKHRLLEKTLVFSRLRVFRLAEIIQKQEMRGKGIISPYYKTWGERLDKSKNK